jgi:hypothetical protein
MQDSVLRSGAWPFASDLFDRVDLVAPPRVVPRISYEGPDVVRGTSNICGLLEMHEPGDFRR